MSRTVTFEAAHRLPKVLPSHKCYRLHGHTYRLTAWVRGPVKEDGFVLDSGILHDALLVIRHSLDHKNLNELKYLGGNPTAENLLAWIWKALLATSRVGPILHRVELREGANGIFAYEGDQCETR